MQNLGIDLTKRLIENFSLWKTSDEQLLARYVRRHFPELHPTSEKGKRLERTCKVCYDEGKVKGTSYYCPDCGVGLYAAPFFRLCHQPKGTQEMFLMCI